MSFDLPRPTGIDWGSADRTYGQVKFGDDSQMVVVFYTKPVFNAALSKAKGVRQYENQQWIKMHPPGERLHIIDRPIQEGDKRRFPHQWNMFLQNKTQVPDGTPIDLLFPNNPAVADNLRAFGVHTIQQCSKLSAHAIDTIGMGANDWKNMAVKYLENASSGTAFLQMRSELEAEKQKNKLTERKLEQVQRQLDDVLNRINNPNAVLQPGFVENYDVTAERVNNLHPSNEVKTVRRSKKAPPAAEVEQANVIKQVTEEDFATKDVTKDTGLDFGLGEDK